VLPSFLAGGPKHAPGTHWEYWNQGYALLAEIIERTAGESYTAFCKRRLFARAKAATACFTGDAEPAGVSVAIGRAAANRGRR
jgi:CubicO group peptidase (beta-lactamase class C family)